MTHLVSVCPKRIARRCNKEMLRVDGNQWATSVLVPLGASNGMSKSYKQHGTYVSPFWDVRAGDAQDHQVQFASWHAEVSLLDRSRATFVKRWSRRRNHVDPNSPEKNKEILSSGPEPFRRTNLEKCVCVRRTTYRYLLERAQQIQTKRTNTNKFANTFTSPMNSRGPTRSHKHIMKSREIL